MSGAGVLTPTAAFAADPQPAYLLGSTINGWTETLAIATAADTVTVASDAEADAVDWANASGRTIAFRGPATGGPAAYSYVRPAASGAYFSAPWFNMRTNYAQELVCRSADVGDKAQWRLSAVIGDTLFKSYLVLTGNVALEDLDLYAPWGEALNYNTTNGIAAFTFSGGERQQRFGALDARNTIGNLRIERCTLRGNLTDFPLSGPRTLAWYGLLGDDGTGKVAGTWTLRDNDVRGARRLLELPDCVSGGSFVVEGNELHDFGVDCLVIGGRASGSRIRWNHFHSPWNAVGDDGHGDFIQFVYAGTEDIADVLLDGNVFNSYRYDGVAVKHDTQLIFCADIGQPGTPAWYKRFRIFNNVGLTESAHGISLQPGMDCDAWRNTFAKDLTSDTAYGTPRIQELVNGLIPSEPANNRLTKNITSLVQLRAGSGSTKTGNFETSANAAVYADTFVKPGRPASRADLLARFAPKPGSAAAINGAGAIGPYCDFDARTIDLTGAPWL